VLREGGVVAYPTETFYGLGANALEASACDKILRLKGHRENKPLTLIVGGIEQIDVFVESHPPWLELVAKRFWPGPLSLVLPVSSHLSGPMGRYSSVVVRVSSHFVARELARTAGFPLTATSANPSNEPPARTADEAVRPFGSNLDVVLDGGPTPGGRPSTIVDLNGPTPRLIRRGPIALEDVVKVLEEPAE
jgi:L-threonylcarbamoyladenylate synthase